ncbi:ABC transporter ATP-binding protein [Chloroflexota bacterium]
MNNRTEPVIILNKASVRYLSPVESYWSFKEYLLRLIKRQVKKYEYIALNEVSLEISRGEFIGIIGRNGAGKTTLLKLVSRVLAPSSGSIIVRGIVSPMLELGAGFHYELTGRENIFLNGSLLGHSNNEIKEHIPKILEFARIDKYIDAPLRTYSSGMVARLGFAIATSWVPEILILDEILAVGDEEFRKKCFERMRHFRREGTTILLVSHNMETIQKHCSRAVWLEKGSVMDIGNANEVSKSYLKHMVI